MKPVTCREIGCSGASCKYYKPIEKYPFFKCMYLEYANDNGIKWDKYNHRETTEE
jgi:hypothetical protein